MSESGYEGFVPSLKDVLLWCRNNRVTPVPCSPRSKKPVSAISRRTLYQDDPGGSGFLTPTPERLRAIGSFWDRYAEMYNYNHVSISLVADPGYNDGRNLCCLDIDTDEFVAVFLLNPFFTACPAITGGKGVKVFFFLDSVPEQGIIQWKRRNDQRHPVFELFTWHKHALIYGEHPSSQVQERILYRWIKAEPQIPLLSWKELMHLLLVAEQQYALSATGIVGQQDLSGWF